MPVTYSSYLKLEELLSLQQPVSKGPEHDETLFVVIHQVYELWFKQLLHEFDYLSKNLVANKTTPSLHTLKRILTVLKTMVAQIDILETMTPLDFLSFRDRLESGSGFQSCQFRELEFVLGIKSKKARERFSEGSTWRKRLDMRFTQPTIWDAFLHYLAANDYGVAKSQLTRDVTKPIEADAGVQELLIDVYRNDATTTQVCERLIDFDEGFQEWRYRHVKMVQRTIGTRSGTGGSSGAEYLITTLFKPIFPDLWDIRAEL